MKLKKSFTNKTKNRKGITLIALVITIIILLILAGVSISLLTGENGIINQTENARNTTSKAEEKEKIGLAIATSLTNDKVLIDKKILRDELSKIDGLQGVPEESANGEYNYNLPLTIIGKYGDEYVIDDKGNITESEWKDNGDFTFTNKDGMTVKIGEYVNYNHLDGATETSYTSVTERNGYGNQVFNLADYVEKWIVLGISESGNLQLVSSYLIGPSSGGIVNKTDRCYSLKGQIGYEYGVEELDKISQLYGQGKYAESARSLKIEDINKITGYVDTNYVSENDETSQTGNEVTYTKKSNGLIYCKGTKYPTAERLAEYSNLTYWNGNSWQTLNQNESVTIKNDGYSYFAQTLTYDSPTGEVSINGNTSEEAIRAWYMLFRNGRGKTLLAWF
ncbi:MAG: hypothetical protein HUJ68_03745 [Clostridia bacterium]|nr:hypothetical protein [Clostridia bacterium]